MTAICPKVFANSATVRFAWLGLIAMALTGCAVAEVIPRERASAALQRGDYQAARPIYEDLVNQQPTNPFYHYGLGESHLNTGSPEDAEMSLERAWALAPNDQSLTPEILDSLAEAYYRQDETRRLQQFLRNTVQQYQSVNAYLRQGEYLAKIGDVDGARSAYQAAARYAEPGNAHPYLELASFYSSINDRGSAVQAVRSAYQEDPNSPAVQQRMQQYGIQPGPDAAAPSPSASAN